MSETTDQPDRDVTDDQLPEELRPTDDNPLAQPLDEEDARSPEELDVLGGKSPEQSASDADEGSDEGPDGERDTGQPGA